MAAISRDACFFRRLSCHPFDSVSAMAELSQFTRTGRPPRRRFDLASLLAVVAACGLCSAGLALGGSNHAGGLVPSRLTARSSVTRHFEYIFDAGGIQVYDIDHDNRYPGQIAFRVSRSVDLSPIPLLRLCSLRTGGREAAGTGSMLAYDLVSGRTLWRRNYSTGVDNIAITPNGRKIYMAVGEAYEQHYVGDRQPKPAAGSRARSRAARDRMRRSLGLTASTSISEASTRPYLEIGSTSTGRIVGRSDRCRDRCPAVHDQRDPDAGVHDILGLPWLSGQQHRHGKGALQRFSARVSVRPHQRSAPSPTTASRSPPTDDSST